MGKAVRDGRLKIVLEIVDVHLGIGEGLSRSNVKVSDNLVDPETSVDTATLLGLSLELLLESFFLALLNACSVAECPPLGSICLTDIVASLTAAGLFRGFGGAGAVAFTTVVWVEMFWVLRVDLEGIGLDDAAVVVETVLGDTMADGGLKVARDVHDIEGQQLTRHFWECDVEVDLHLLT